MSDSLFTALATALARTGLDDGRGGLRSASADEFMYMYEDAAGDHWFKHRASRNYIMLASCSEPYITVPMGGSFRRGTFPAPA
jgi:hypothetical protein